MLALCIVMTVLTACTCLIWVSRHVQIWREKRTAFILTDQYAGPQQPAAGEGVSPQRETPPIDVLVAAKDEEANIETCLRGLLAQDYPHFETIVCDDRSTDRTGGIVDSLAAEDPRLRVIHVKELPEGWCGKNNAMRIGIASSRAEWICMTDADCRFLSPRMLSAALRYALDTGADMLSVLPILEMRGFWENVVQPVSGGVMMIWFRPDRVNDPAKPNAYANGAFILMKRSAYDGVGGHEAVKDQVNEDMHMAARVKGAGLRLRVVRSRGLYLVRMYTSLGRIMRGWSRIFFGTFGTLRRLTVSLALMFFMGTMGYLSAGLGLAMALSGGQPAAWWWACGLVGAATVAIQISVIYRFYRLVGARPELAWTYLLGCIVIMASLASAIRKLRPGAKVVWRSTSYTRRS